MLAIALPQTLHHNITYRGSTQRFLMYGSAFEHFVERVMAHFTGLEYLFSEAAQVQHICYYSVRSQ